MRDAVERARPSARIVSAMQRDAVGSRRTGGPGTDGPDTDRPGTDGPAGPPPLPTALPPTRRPTPGGVPDAGQFPVAVRTATPPAPFTTGPRAGGPRLPPGFRWIAVRPGPPPPPRAQRRPLGPTPRYAFIPRWGLVDNIAPSGEVSDAKIRNGPSPATVRGVLLSAMAIFVMAALVHVPALRAALVQPHHPLAAPRSKRRVADGGGGESRRRGRRHRHDRDDDLVVDSKTFRCLPSPRAGRPTAILGAVAVLTGTAGQSGVGAGVRDRTCAGGRFAEPTSHTYCLVVGRLDLLDGNVDLRDSDELHHQTAGDRRQHREHDHRFTPWPRLQSRCCGGCSTVSSSNPSNGPRTAGSWWTTLGRQSQTPMPEKPTVSRRRELSQNVRNRQHRNMTADGIPWAATRSWWRTGARPPIARSTPWPPTSSRFRRAPTASNATYA